MEGVSKNNLQIIQKKSAISFGFRVRIATCPKRDVVLRRKLLHLA